MRKTLTAVLLAMILCGLLVITPLSFAAQTEEEAAAVPLRIYFTGIEYGQAGDFRQLPKTCPYTYVQEGYIYHGVLDRYGYRWNGNTYTGLYQGFVHYTGNTVTMLEE